MRVIVQFKPDSHWQSYLHVRSVLIENSWITLQLEDGSVRDFPVSQFTIEIEND